METVAAGSSRALGLRCLPDLQGAGAALRIPAIRLLLPYGVVAQRVLLTSFSGRRRRGVLRLVPTAATSASSAGIAGVVAGLRLRTPAITRTALRGVQAVQIPEHALRTDLAAPWSIAAMHAAGVEVHFWVVNDPIRMRELIARGADGIVTDRAELARDALR